jgi:hypothetical protein
MLGGDVLIAGCVDTDLPTGRRNQDQSNRFRNRAAHKHHAMQVNSTETRCVWSVVRRAVGIAVGVKPSVCPSRPTALCRPLQHFCSRVQSGERHLRMAEVRGSNPLVSTPKVHRLAAGETWKTGEGSVHAPEPLCGNCAATRLEYGRSQCVESKRKDHLAYRAVYALASSLLSDCRQTGPADAHRNRGLLIERTGGRDSSSISRWASARVCSASALRPCFSYQ